MRSASAEDRTMSQPNRRTALAMLAAGMAGSGLSVMAATSAPPGRTLSRGINVPDWTKLVDGRAPASSVLSALAERGFNTIRLRVNSDDWVGDASRRRLAAQLVENALDMSVRAGFSVMLEFHADTGLRNAFVADLTQAEADTTAAWTELSQVAASFSPDSVMPELLNEPPLERKHWLPLRDRLAETVRKACPGHTLIWGADSVYGIWETIDCRPLADDNCMVAVHYYTPMGFTHQCADWDNSGLALMANLPFPANRRSPEALALAEKFRSEGQTNALALLEQEFSSDWTVARIEADFAELGNWSRETGTPIVVNEFGVLNSCVDAQSRATWTRAVRQAIEGIDAGWAYWELDQGFGLLDNRNSASGFEASVVAALMEN